MEVEELLKPFPHLIDAVEFDRCYKDIIVETTDSSVIVIPSRNLKIKVSLYGSSLVRSFIFYCENEEKSILSLKSTASNLKCSCLLIELPHRCFQTLYVSTQEHNIYIFPSVCVKDLSLHTSSGYVETDCSFKSVTINTLSGTIDLRTIGRANISLKISSLSGLILADFSGIGFWDANVKSKEGEVRLRPLRKLGHRAIGSVKTRTGNIRIIY